jgi:hypothetical protein
MKITLPLVHSVPLNVPLVVLPLIIVSLVLKEELDQPMVVHVKTDNISTMLTNTVEIVPTNVPLALLKPPVSLVLILPEMTDKFVTVKITIMKMEPLNVQLVKPNVTFVSTVHPTVPFVLKEESIHQNVTFLHQPLKPLMLPISQLVPLKLLSVTINVDLVKELLITV